MSLLVSIIMPSYNASRFISESIDSVLRQTYPDWELLICDDCSKDNTLDIAHKYEQEDKRVRVFSLSTNSGAAAARNYSLSQAKGQIIAFLDSDDIWKPNKLEKQLSFMLGHRYAFTYTEYELMNEEGALLHKSPHMPQFLSYSQYLRNTAIGCLTVMVDKRQVGEFMMPSIRSSQDMATWLLLLKRIDKAYLFPENLAIYRLVSNSNSAKKVKAAKDVWRVYREIERLSFLKSAISFGGYVFNALMRRI